jgi:hypothetical protein
MRFEISTTTRCAGAQSLRGILTAAALVTVLLWSGLAAPAAAQSESQAPGYCDTHPDGQSFLGNLGRFLHLCPDSGAHSAHNTPIRATTLPVVKESMPQDLDVTVEQNAAPVATASPAADGAGAPPATQPETAPAGDAAPPPIQPSP